MASDNATPAGGTVPADVIPPGHLPPLEYRDLPEPISLRQMIGPSVILAGLSLGSGEFVLWPYITYQSQFIFFWACLLGVTTQYFINMEVTRWTLATGESAITGFARLSRQWAWVFLLANTVPYVIPAWGTGAAQLFTWLIWPPEVTSTANGIEVIPSAGAGYLAWIAIAGLLFCGVLLTAGPVVYKTVEKTQLVLVGVVLVLVVIVAAMVVRTDAVTTMVRSTVTFGAPVYVPLGERFGGLDPQILLGALAFAGCGGTLNLGQSNYVKDKGFGMGKWIGRITSPVTGQEEAVAEIGYHFPGTPANMARWKTWWRRASQEHFWSFFATCAFCLIVLTLISYSLVYTPGGERQEGMRGYGNNMLFIHGEAEQLRSAVGGIGPLLFLVMGIAILFTTELAVLDATSRVSTDIIKTNWLRDSTKWSESRIYFTWLWCEIALGISILVVNRAQVANDTLNNFRIVAALNGGIMCIYSGTLLWLNCRFLPAPLRMSWPRRAIMLWSVLFFGFFGVWASWNVVMTYLTPSQ